MASVGSENPSQVLFKNVNIFNGTEDRLYEKHQVLVNGNPLHNIEVMADPGTSFEVIMKDGKIYKNTLQ